jgi:hypothetical protein
MVKDKLDKEIDTRLKRRSQKDLLSPSSLAIFGWFILVVLAPYVLDWFGMGASFWGSIEFEGMVSLVVIVVVVFSFALDAVKK